ncbi:DUF397 domain-containing protein [Saccharothrix algeriensis]|uniref:DUF397 domain-containing protein n=1 Tax=Saccharothrix algeriensis TaxID=173560 RepID=A0A8T8HVA2_9PSEU|nr:DUF397 domain-containing protein [Saccharothrix algeriensis]MBM7814113.1 hypothetical protein [Saccharothrix algeriensis]QTR02493.1 DUF397 domain-containing protein [Saccharothrix algeriensis]
MLRWRKSSYTNAGNDPQCVELACPDDERRAVRDSKHRAGPELTFPAAAFRAFLADARK